MRQTYEQRAAATRVRRGRSLIPLPVAISVLLLLGPVASGDEPIHRIAFGSCNKEHKPQPIWRALLDSKPDVWVWLGDIVYGNADDPQDLARRYAKLKSHPDYAVLRTQTRVLGVWDDADYGKKSGGRENEKKDESQRLLLDFLDEPGDSARRQQRGVHASYTFGPPGRRVKIILLDGRYHRESRWPLLRWVRRASEPDVLGAEQWQWLEQQLTGSAADVYLIGSGIQVIPTEHLHEKWADFPEARQRLFDLVARSGARNVIFFSGDRHLGEISRLQHAGYPQPIYDITSSGLTHHAEDNWLFNFSGEPNRLRVGQNFLGLNFGLIEIDWERATATLQVRGLGNAVHRSVRVPLSLPAKLSLPDEGGD